MNKPKIVNTAIDSLYFSCKGTLDHDFINILEVLKNQAIESGKDEIYKILDYKFAVKPYGGRGYKYKMENNSFSCSVTDSNNFPNLYIQIRASYLYELSDIKAYKKIKEWIKKSGIFIDRPKTSLSRIDLCTDFQGFIFRKEDADRIVCKATSDSGYGLLKNFTGFSFGKGDIVLRIYNKSFEIKQSNKDWMIEVWKKSELYNEKQGVWRIELQLRRNSLKQFNINNPEGSFDKLKGLWDYGLNWCQVKEISSNKQKSRWKEDKSWQYIRENASFSGKKEVERVTESVNLTNERKIISGLAGYFTSYCAIKRLELFEEALPFIYRDFELHYQKKNQTIEGVIKEKSERII